MSIFHRSFSPPVSLSKAAGMSSAWIAGCWLLSLAGACSPALGAEPEPGFKAILEKRNRETFQVVSDYATKNPDARDISQAYAWLMENAVRLHLEAEAIPVADAIYARTTNPTALRNLAQQVKGLGLARSGRIPEALEALQAQLGVARFRSASSVVEFGLLLATVVQSQGDFPATREIYERLSEAFPLNKEVRQLAERRLARLELVGKPAPPVHAKDLEGKDVDLADYAGKVVLVDFWATFCAPCIEELPNLLRIYAEYHPRGLEVVGISLDEDRGTVESFQQRANIPWTLVMNDADNTLGKPYSVPTIPALFLLDRKGNVVNVDLKGADLDAAIRRLLDSPP